MDIIWRDNPMRKGPQESWQLTDDEIAFIEEKTQKGMREDTIARLLGMHSSTFSALKKKDPRIDDAIKKGSAHIEEMAVGNLYFWMSDRDHKNCLTATIFYLKTRCGYKETSEVVHTEKPTKLNYSVIPSKASNE